MPNKTILEILDALRNDAFTVKSIFSSTNHQYKETVFVSGGKQLLIAYVSGNNIIREFCKDLIEYLEFYDSDNLLISCDKKQLQEDLEFLVMGNYEVEYL